MINHGLGEAEAAKKKADALVAEPLAARRAARPCFLAAGAQRSMAVGARVIVAAVLARGTVALRALSSDER